MFAAINLIAALASAPAIATDDGNGGSRNTLEVEPVFTAFGLIHLKYLRAVSSHTEVGAGYLWEHEYGAQVADWNYPAHTALFELNYYFRGIRRGPALGAYYWMGPSRVSRDDRPDVEARGVLTALQLHAGYAWRSRNDRLSVVPFVGVDVWTVPGVEIDGMNVPWFVFPAAGANLGVSF